MREEFTADRRSLMVSTMNGWLKNSSMSGLTDQSFLSLSLDNRSAVNGPKKKEKKVGRTVSLDLGPEGPSKDPDYRNGAKILVLMAMRLLFSFH